MGVVQPFGGNAFDKLGLNLVDVLARRHAGAVARRKICINCHSRLVERDVEDHVGGLAPDAGQSHQFVAGLWNFATKSVISILHSAITFFALLRYRPMVLI